ncbi:DNA binding HTH domain Psq-type [Trinorchestia longiramus]|nr:DNA binding HTH domain Psq-type [Trinorchestia longiramus]
MGPKKDSDKGKAKRKTVRTTIELKKEIIAKYESDVRVSDLASQYEMAKSTISTILKHKEVLKKADVAIGVTAINKQRPQIMEEMEKLLLIFTIVHCCLDTRSYNILGIFLNGKNGLKYFQLFLMAKLFSVFEQIDARPPPQNGLWSSTEVRL